MTAKEMPVALCDNGKPPKFWVALIKYENIEGRHIFTSDSIEGLLVVSTDARTVMRQIQPAIEMLIEANLGVKCTVVLGHEFKDFEKKHNMPVSTKEEKISLKDAYAIINTVAA